MEIGNSILFCARAPKFPLLFFWEGAPYPGLHRLGYFPAPGSQAFLVSPLMFVFGASCAPTVPVTDLRPLYDTLCSRARELTSSARVHCSSGSGPKNPLKKASYGSQSELCDPCPPEPSSSGAPYPGMIS